LESDNLIGSENDAFNLSSVIKNAGIEPADIILTLKITNPEGEVIKLEPEKLKLDSEEEKKVSWFWRAPSDAVHGDYQFGVMWEFPNTGENATVPGNIFELKPRHSVELLTVTTDKDYYLSVQDVHFNLFFTDNGTRAGNQVMTINYQILSTKGKQLFKNTLEDRIGEGGSELIVKWPIPEDMDSGPLNFSISLNLGEKELINKQYPSLINVEQPILLKFDIIKPTLKTSLKGINKYVLEGEKIISEENYFDLKIIKLSSNTKMLLYHNKVVGGVAWNKMNRNKKVTAEELYFSYLMINKGVNPENLKQMRSKWNEIGAVWSAKLINIGRILKKGEIDDRIFSGRTKELFTSSKYGKNHDIFDRLKKYLSLEPKDLNDWQEFAKPLIAPVKFIDYKKLREILKHSYDDKYGKSILGLIISYLEYGKIKDKGAVAAEMKDYIETLNSAVSSAQIKDRNSISRSLEKWYSYLKSQRIEIQVEEEISALLELIYSIVMLKLISRIIEINDTVLAAKKITKKQFVRLGFALTSYHILYIEYLQNNIRYNRYMDEELSREDLARHFDVIEQLGTD
jgi:hypothetical protein